MFKFLDSSFFFYPEFLPVSFSLFSPESYNLPAKPSLELAVGQIKSCLKQMSKSGLGVCAFVNVDDFINR